MTSPTNNSESTLPVEQEDFEDFHLLGEDLSENNNNNNQMDEDSNRSANSYHQEFQQPILPLHHQIDESLAVIATLNKTVF